MMDTNLRAFLDKAIARRPIEADIVSKIVKALKDSGNPVVKVDDFEELNPVQTTQDVLDQVFNLDEAYLITESGAWVRLVMGEEWDIICDYNTSLEAALKPVNDWIEKNW